MCLSVPDTTQLESQAEEFAERLVGIANHAATALMISVGHRTGLFDTLAQLPSATSEGVARAADLEERYVREWLSAMTVAGLVFYDPVRKTFRFPPQHAALLTRQAGADNLGVMMQYLAVLGSVEDDIVHCFREGGGVPYSRFGRFHEVMAEDSGQVVDAMLLDAIVPLVPGLAARLEAGIDVLDVGCGAGRALQRLAERFPASRFLGVDLSPEPIADARRRVAELGLSNVEFEVRDASRLEFQSEFEFVTTFDAVHDQAQPAVVLAAIRRALRPDGVYLMQDIAGSSHLQNNLEHPLAPFLYTVSCMHCMTVSLAGDGLGLGTLWGQELAVDMLHDAGFRDVELHRLDGDPVNTYYVSRPAA